MSTQHDVDAAARRLAGVLEAAHLKIVFAESCTGGLVSASLARIPGISNRLCGSAVVYQMQTKAEWLEIPKSLLDKAGPVSREAAAQMAENVLAKTPQADVAVSVTGHLGPDAPKRQDGLLYVAVAFRPAVPGKSRSRPPDGTSTDNRRLTLVPGPAGPSGPTDHRRARSANTLVTKHRLAPETAGASATARRTLRARRQRVAAQFVLRTAQSALAGSVKSD